MMVIAAFLIAVMVFLIAIMALVRAFNGPFLRPNHAKWKYVCNCDVGSDIGCFRRAAHKLGIAIKVGPAGHNVGMISLRGIYILREQAAKEHALLRIYGDEQAAMYS